MTTPVHQQKPNHTTPHRWQPPPDAPCITAHHLGVNFFPDRNTPGYDAGRTATSICATCPHAASCTTAAVARNERWGTWGGTGGARRRALRRHWNTTQWPDALAAHLRRLHNDPPEPGDDELLTVHGTGAECGTRAKFAKGHRCDACSLAAGLEGALASAGRGRSITGAIATWKAAS